MEQDEGKVRVMSQRERDDYAGATIEEGSGTEERGQGQRSSYRAGIYGRVFTVKNLSWRELLFGQGNWLNRLLIAAGIAAVLAFLLFVALPLLVVLVGVGLAVWLVMHFILGN